MSSRIRYILPDKCQVHVRYEADNLQRDPDEHLKSAIFDQMRGQLAQLITRDKIEIQEKLFTNIYRLDVYVLTGEQLMELIREEGRKYALMRRDFKYE